MKLKTGCMALDALLGGGIENATLTELFGEGGSGKTNLCLQLARNCAKDAKRAIYIDTEGVSPERFSALFEGLDKERELVLFFEPFSLEEQGRFVDQACRIAQGDAHVGVIVIDSLTSFYRINLGCGEEGQDRNELARQLAALHKTARKMKVPVVITNQVYTSLAKDSFEPLGGHLLEHSAKTIIKMERLSGSRRRAMLRKHRAIQDGSMCELNITDTGIE